MATEKPSKEPFPESEPPRCPMNGCNSLMYPFEGKMLCSNIGCRYSRPLAEQAVVESAGKLTAKQFYDDGYRSVCGLHLGDAAFWFEFAEAFHAAASAEMDDSQLLREERDIFKEDNIKQYAECEKLEAEVRELRELLAKTKSWIHPTSTLFAEIESVLGKG